MHTDAGGVVGKKHFILAYVLKPLIYLDAQLQFSYIYVSICRKRVMQHIGSSVDVKHINIKYYIIKEGEFMIKWLKLSMQTYS
jgi:hypothetical protein